jgi:hypothetical protein
MCVEAEAYVSPFSNECLELSENVMDFVLRDRLQPTNLQQ